MLNLHLGMPTYIQQQHSEFMEIRPENDEILLQKLTKIKCCTGCLNNINYLVFNYGLYCTNCLSKIHNLAQDNFINLGTLAKVLADMSKNYSEKTKGQVSQSNIVKGEVKTLQDKIKKLHDFLVHDLKTVKNKTNTLIDQFYNKCLRQNQNTAMEALFEPDLTVTSIVNQSQLLTENLANLKVDNKEGKIEYRFQQINKKPSQINKKIKHKYKELKEKMNQIRLESNTIIEDFRKTISQ